MTPSGVELGSADREAVEAAATEVRRALSEGELDVAASAMDHAWSVLPEPKLQWDFYPQVLARTFADQLARAGRSDDAVRWLRRARAAYGAPEIGDHVVLDVIDARIRLGLGREREAVTIIATTFQAHGRGPFRDDNADLLSAAGLPHQPAGGDSDPVVDSSAHVPPANGGVEVERPDLDEQIEHLSELGSQAADEDDLQTAARRWTDALMLLPAPRSQWTSATWLYTAIGDAHYLDGRLDEAMESFRQAMHCPDATGSAFLLLRLGQALVDSGGIEEGVQALLGAYMLEGAEIFRDEDPRYAELLRDSGLVEDPAQP